MMNEKGNEENLINNDLDSRNTLAINASARPSANSEVEENIEKEKQDIIQEKITPDISSIQLSPYRFVIVVIFFLLNFINGMHWVTFASCGAKFGKFYHLSTIGVDSLSAIYMILYIFTNFPCSYYIDKISMKWGLRISAILIIAGAISKIFLNESLAFAFIGQILTSAFQPAILNSPAKIAATWFAGDSRVVVTSICCLSNTIGVMVGFVIHTFVLEENTVNPKIFKRDFRTYIIIEAAISVAFGLLFIFFIKEKPEKPPSLSQENQTQNRQSFFEDLSQLKKNKNFIYLFISLSCVVGFMNIVATIFNAYMALYKIKDMSASYISAIANIVGIISALIIGLIIDKFKKYRISIMICNIIAIVCYFITMFLMESIKSKNLYLVAGIGYTLIFGACVPIYSSGMDLVCEITYGVGESTSDGIIMIGNQAIGIIGIVITAMFRTYLKKYKWITNAFCICLFLVSLFCLYLVKEDLKRTNDEKEKENEKTIGENETKE